MLKKIAYVMYPAADVPRARRFYEDILGLKPGLAGEHEGKWWVEYDLPQGGCLAISNMSEDQPSANAGGTVAFEVEDLDALIASLETKGVTFASDMIHGPNCRMRVCLDSEGNALLLHQLNRA